MSIRRRRHSPVEAAMRKRTSGTMRGMEFAKTADRRTFIVVDRSGGHSDFDRLHGTPLPPHGGEVTPVASLGGAPSVVQLVRTPGAYADFTERAVLSVAARWLAHWVIFRGGWTVHVDAPDRDPVKIRCRNRAAAERYANRLAADLAIHGPTVLDGLNN